METFKYYTQLLTNNDNYKTGKTQEVKGIMWHSTGANNPYLSRYVAPDDGNLGINKHGNDWNQPRPGGRQVCVHAFIGYLKDKKGVATYQTLPWNHVGWHSGVGKNGSANSKGYIGFEICESDLNDKAYFEQVYEEALNLTVYLCRKYNLTEKDIIDHQEGYKLGIASNHGDVKHWFSRYGISMDDVREEVRRRLQVEEMIQVVLEKWQEDMGIQALDSLNKKKDNKGQLIVDSPEKWKDKLADEVPSWLFWVIIDRITK